MWEGMQDDAGGGGGCAGLACRRGVCAHTQSPRKAAGRALGTMVEIITHYLLESWNLRESISIEAPLGEYGNRETAHNVEYGLHWTEKSCHVSAQDQPRPEPITARAIRSMMLQFHGLDIVEVRATALLSGGVVRNPCLPSKGMSTRWVANYGRGGDVTVSLQSPRPYMIFECRRVGLDAHRGKGPQAIEKAKQGSYVARTASCLQKIRDSHGNAMGIMYSGENYAVGPYNELFDNVIHSGRPAPPGFVATVGVVSSHGNWFTAGSQNKEMAVLAQSYDWLLFLTGRGLAEFASDAVLSGRHAGAKRAFQEGHAAGKKSNRFTKVRMSLEAHRELAAYFKANMGSVEDRFSVITPAGSRLGDLRSQIRSLHSKGGPSRT